VQFVKGCDVSGDRPPSTAELAWMNSYGPPVDVIVAVLGYNATLEGEEGTGDGDGDRHRYGLPGRQQEYLEHLKTLGKPLVLVVTGGSPIDLTWAQQHADAIVMAWYPGEQGGAAVADVLFGDFNPAGRLPVTFPKSYEQLPPFTDYNMAGRTYRFMNAEPLYRFGFGLSYTTFRYSRLKLSRKVISPSETVAVSVDVTNTGKVAGEEVVQLYVSDIEATVPVPRLHLEGVARVHLRPRQKKTVRFVLKPEQLAAFTDDGKPFIEPGQFRISVGGGQPMDLTGGSVSVLLRMK
jgi:beta-glucosidase